MPTPMYTNIPLFLPIPTDPNALLLIAALFIGVMAIIFNIHPEIVLGVGMLVVIVTAISFLWPISPILTIIYGALLLIGAAFLKLAAIGIEGGVRRARGLLQLGNVEDSQDVQVMIADAVDSLFSDDERRRENQ